jgi:hypothetical protein
VTERKSAIGPRLARAARPALLLLRESVILDEEPGPPPAPCGCVSGDLDVMATATTRLRIGPANHGRAMTLRHFLDAEEQEGCLYELARGVLEVSQEPNEPHGVVVSNFCTAVARYHLDHPRFIHRYGGGSEFQFLIPELVSGRHPDLSVVLLAVPKDDRGRRRPALGAEVVSRSSLQRYYVVTREEYRSTGWRNTGSLTPGSARSRC